MWVLYVIFLCPIGPIQWSTQNSSSIWWVSWISRISWISIIRHTCCWCRLLSWKTLGILHAVHNCCKMQNSAADTFPHWMASLKVTRCRTRRQWNWHWAPETKRAALFCTSCYKILTHHIFAKWRKLDDYWMINYQLLICIYNSHLQSWWFIILTDVTHCWLVAV